MSRKKILFIAMALTLCVNVVLGFYFTDSAEKKATENTNIASNTNNIPPSTPLAEPEVIVPEKIDTLPVENEDKILAVADTPDVAVLTQESQTATEQEEAVTLSSEPEKVDLSPEEINISTEIEQEEAEELVSIKEEEPEEVILEPAQEEQQVEEQQVEEQQIEEQAPTQKLIVKAITVGYANNTFAIRVQANQAIKARTLYVAKPERALLDLEGHWQLSTIPALPQNPYATAIRTGYHEGYTRLVIDINTPKFTRSLVQIDENTVELRVIF